MLVYSTYAKQKFVDHTLTDQASILKFVEDNWKLGRIGGESLDAQAGSIENMFDFNKGPVAAKLFLDPATGQPLKMYTVKAGDTVGKIASMYKLDWHELAKINNLANLDLIQVGQKLMLPAGN